MSSLEALEELMLRIREVPDKELSLLLSRYLMELMVSMREDLVAALEGGSR